MNRYIFDSLRIDLDPILLKPFKIELYGIYAQSTLNSNKIYKRQVRFFIVYYSLHLQHAECITCICL